MSLDYTTEVTENRKSGDMGTGCVYHLFSGGTVADLSSEEGRCCDQWEFSPYYGL